MGEQKLKQVEKLMKEQVALQVKEFIKDGADCVRKKIKGGSLFGFPIDEEDIDTLIYCAYLVGLQEYLKKERIL